MENSQRNPADRIYMIKNGEPGTGLNLRQKKASPGSCGKRSQQQRCNPEKKQTLHAA